MISTSAFKPAVSFWRLSRSRTLVACLAFGIALATLSLALHHYEFVAHQGQHICGLCLASSNLDHALTSGPLDTSIPNLYAIFSASRARNLTAPRVGCYRARAPPV